jgi:hypothetical protein
VVPSPSVTVIAIAAIPVVVISILPEIISIVETHDGLTNPI